MKNYKRAIRPKEKNKLTHAITPTDPCLEGETFSTDLETWAAIGNALICVGPQSENTPDYGNWYISILDADRKEFHQEECDGKADAYEKARFYFHLYHKTQMPGVEI